MNRSLIIICAILVTSCVTLYLSNVNLREEKERLASNQEALWKEVETYKTDAGKSAASALKLQLTYDELKDNYQDVCRTAEDLRVKIKRIESASKMATNTELEIKPVLKDSIIYRDTSFVKVKGINWRDSWISVKGSIGLDNRVNLKIVSRDTLRQIIHRVPKRFLFFRFGTKAIRQEIVSSNPHTHIVYSEYVELRK